MKLVSNFAERLKLALEIRNMKASKLSELTNVNKSTISQYLSGEYEAKKDRVELFAEVLNVNELWLRGYEFPMENGDDKEKDFLIKEYQLSADEIREYENIAMTTSTLMFNGKPSSKDWITINFEFKITVYSPFISILAETISISNPLQILTGFFVPNSKYKSSINFRISFFLLSVIIFISSLFKQCSNKKFLQNFF